MRDLVTVDLGVRYVACAAWSRRGNLVAIARIAGSSSFDVGLRFGGWVARWPGARVVVETPQDYAGKDGRRATLARMRETRDALLPEASVHPSRWKGNVPKRVHAVRIWTALDESEQALLLVERIVEPVPGAALSAPAVLDHDVIDAVGLGLYELGRVGRGGVRR